MVKVAIPTWCGRISPVLDTAGHLLVVTAHAGQQVHRQEAGLTAKALSDRAGQIADLKPDVLICGAVSRVLEALLLQRGITVISHVCGDVEQVLRGYLAGESLPNQFGMPGCHHRRRHRAGCRGGRRRNRWMNAQ